MKTSNSKTKDRFHLEAMTFHRPYRAALGIKKAMQELKDNSGSKYDSGMVGVAMKILNENNFEPFWLNQEPPN